jgi:NADPH:quinone reductase-like Zn-dependent oxidoreductase
LLFVPIGQARSDPADCHHPVERIVGNIVDVTKLVDAGRIRTTLTETLSPINAETLKKAHALIETGKARGKIVLEGF